MQILLRYLALKNQELLGYHVALLCDLMFCYFSRIFIFERHSWSKSCRCKYIFTIGMYRNVIKHAGIKTQCQSMILTQ